MLRTLVEKSLVLALLIVIHDAYCIGKTRIVYPRLLEARSSTSSLSLFINDEITLNLERADIFPEVFVLRYPEGETEVNKYINGADLNNLVYHDKNQMSAVSIARDDGFYVNGIINNTYQIKPYPMERSDTGRIAHELVEVEEPYSTLYGDSPQEEPNELPAKKSTALPNTVYPEIMVIADIDLAKTVGRGLTLEEYVGLLFATANLRFLSMRQPRLTLRLCAVKVMTDQQKNEIYNFIKDDEGVSYLDANGTLYNLASEVQSASYADYDIVTLLTQHNLALQKRLFLDTATEGYAFLGGSCSKNKVSVVEEAGLGLVGASTLAHETAHLLGCPHDGDGPPTHIQNAPGARSCPRNDGYLMGDLYADAKDRRKYELSRCCVASILHLLRLESSKCLRTRKQKTYVNTNQLPGSAITPNQTCEVFLKNLALNDGFHDKTDGGLKQCDLKCITPLDEHNAYSMANTPAPDGTSCDISKICRLGKCVAKKN